MKKTPVVFVMDHDSETITSVVRPGSEWVVNGEGTATIKFDGSACLWKEGRLWKRYDRKLNKHAQRQLDAGKPLLAADETLFKSPPVGFVPCEATPDPVSFHWPGWVPVSDEDPADKWHREALAEASGLEEGMTYELVGPSLASNPYELARHSLWKHGRDTVSLADRSIEGLKEFLTQHYVEGLVFHHPDGRMAKLRRKDFGLFWIKEDTRKRKITRSP